MRLFYNIGIRLYVLLIHVATLFNSKAKSWVTGRKKIFELIEQKVDVTKKTAWFHVSSLGEFEQGRPVIEAFKQKYPNYQIVLTFFSPSGYEVRKNYALADAIFYLPYDSAKNARRFIQLVNPDIAFFVKYEFWFHYLSQLNKQSVPTYIFSAIFRPSQHFFKWYGGWYRKMLTYFTFLFVQNQKSEQLLKNIGINNVAIGGDTRFDRVYQIAQESKDIPEFELFCKDKKVIVAGSTWDKDEQLLKHTIETLGDDVRLILAPHEIHSSNIKRIEKLFGNACVCFSKKDEVDISKAQVLIIDSIGLLSSLYKYGQVSYIGGGFGVGIHNTLEAATYGVPVIFGPKYQKFQEAVDLIENGAAFSIQNQDELKNKFHELFFNENQRNLCGKEAINYVNKMRGGTALLLDKIAF